MAMASLEAASGWDVVVVGAGGAGLAAAAEAAALGGRVLLIEKSSEAGGNTARALGLFAAAGTELQRRAGIDDRPQWHDEDLERCNGTLAARDHPGLRRMLVEQAPDALAWVRSLGVPFAAPIADPSHRVPRLHLVLPQGSAVVGRLLRHARDVGVVLRTHTRAVGLLSEGGRVVGVECTTPAGREQLAAGRAVVLASGDYSADRELKSRYGPAAAADIAAVNRSATGDGHKLALALGAQVVNGDMGNGAALRCIGSRKPSLLHRLLPAELLTRSAARMHGRIPARWERSVLLGFGSSALRPSPQLFAEGAILVNVEGWRCDRTLDPVMTVPKQPYHIAFIVFDSRIAQRFRRGGHRVWMAPGVGAAYLDDYRPGGPALLRSGATFEALGEAMGVPSQTLERSMRAHNAEVAADARLEQPPYYALGPVKSYCIHTDGGLAVSERLEVLGRDGSPIGGLFAAGAAGQGGLLLGACGHRLPWAIVSGRVAGRHAIAGNAAEPAMPSESAGEPVMRKHA